MVLCIVVGCLNEVESLRAKGCFVYLRLLQITGKNRRNSLLRGETMDFLGESRGCYKLRLDRE